MIRLFDDNPNLNAITKIVEVLRNGGVIIYPTDTVYALGCDIFQTKALEKICRIKGVDVKKAKFSVMCDSLKQISEFTKMDDDTFKIIKKNTPGPFTFILDGNNKLPKLFKERKTIGIRIPDRNLVKVIVQELGNPIFTTSLRIDGQEPDYEVNAELIKEKYGSRVDLIIDGGLGVNSLSTVVDCTGDDLEIIRQGVGELIL
ncbi:MAG: L-threonylcarbamoyladenylate synthase [Candidatus Aphodosoma sp.]|nr:L-threonylcarbamoyladenylate synthase [Candidatus Aphodosoma sp.]